MARALTVPCGTLAFSKFARLSGHVGPTQSLRDGCDQHDLNAWIIYLFSTKPIYVEFYQRMSPNIICGDRTARSDRELHAALRCLPQKGSRKIIAKPAPGGCTTSISLRDISAFLHTPRATTRLFAGEHICSPAYLIIPFMATALSRPPQIRVYGLLAARRLLGWRRGGLQAAPVRGLCKVPVS